MGAAKLQVFFCAFFLEAWQAGLLPFYVNTAVKLRYSCKKYSSFLPSVPLGSKAGRDYRKG